MVCAYPGITASFAVGFWAVPIGGKSCFNLRKGDPSPLIKAPVCQIVQRNLTLVRAARVAPTPVTWNNKQEQPASHETGCFDSAMLGQKPGHHQAGWQVTVSLYYASGNMIPAGYKPGRNRVTVWCEA